MHTEIFIPIILFLVTGLVIISWIYFRFKEKQIMLEKGLTPEQMLDLLKSKKSPTMMLKIGIVSIFFGIGLGLGIYSDEIWHLDAAVPFFIFVLTGLGFVMAFFVDRKFNDQAAK
ncbi:MAG: DUF6249 domain-containing protein [bacterium]